jgi:hypothetical protein
METPIMIDGVAHGGQYRRRELWRVRADWNSLSRLVWLFDNLCSTLRVFKPKETFKEDLGKPGRDISLKMKFTLTGISPFLENQFLVFLRELGLLSSEIFDTVERNGDTWTFSRVIELDNCWSGYHDPFELFKQTVFFIRSLLLVIIDDSPKCGDLPWDNIFPLGETLSSVHLRSFVPLCKYLTCWPIAKFLGNQLPPLPKLSRSNGDSYSLPNVGFPFLEVYGLMSRISLIGSPHISHRIVHYLSLHPFFRV